MFTVVVVEEMRSKTIIPASSGAGQATATRASITDTG